MAEDALTCFQTLVRSIPMWITEMEEIVKYATERQRQMLLENQLAGNGDYTSNMRRKVSKASSSGTKDLADDVRKSLELLRPQLPHLTDSDALRLLQRQRKTASAASGSQSGPLKYRSQSLIVIYYDGLVQKRFDKLVRSIAGSRNDVRKGKTGARVEALSRTGSSSSSGNGSAEEEFSPSSTKFHYKRTTRSALSTFGRNDGTEAFDRVDSRLEQGQLLCERAAHQLLRDGDCSKEIAKIVGFFNEALQLARDELPAVQRRAEKAAQRRRRSEERKRNEHAKSPDDMEGAPIVFHAMPPGETPLAIDVLEVDDDSDEDFGEYNVNSFQMDKLSSFRRGQRIERPMARTLS